MKKIVFSLILLPNFLYSQHVSKVYYNIINEDRSWFKEPMNVDFYVELKTIDYSLELVTNNDEETSYVLTDTIYSTTNFTKWKAFDWKGEFCDVSIGKDLEENQYFIIQYEDMGWCGFLDKNE